MNHEYLHAQIGRFVLMFQTVEAAMVELTVQFVDADPEYVTTLHVISAGIFLPRECFPSKTVRALAGRRAVVL